MPAQKSSVSSLFGAVVGTLGFSALAGVLATVMVAPAIAMTGITANNTIGIFESLPEYIELNAGHQQNEIVAVNPDGSTFPIATIFDQNREEVELSQMSDYLKWAAIAGEDRRFEDHGGVDIPSVIRAAVGQAAGSDAGGASTLTMQTVRNILVQDHCVIDFTEHIGIIYDPVSLQYVMNALGANDPNFRARCSLVLPVVSG